MRHAAFAAHTSIVAGRGTTLAVSDVRDTRARVEQMLLKFEPRAMGLTLADELLLTVRG